jgi:alpha-tubulin suppressor-like RCC1 family protein
MRRHQPATRRSQRPYWRALADESDSDDTPQVSITKSSLRGRPANDASEKLFTESSTSPISGKRQRTNPAGDFVVPPHTNGHSSKIVTIKYKSRGNTVNQPPVYRDSEIYVTGQGLQGQLGIAPRKTHKGVPSRADAFDPYNGPAIVQIASGPSHCAALTSEGTIITWGSNVLGALGRDTGRSDEDDAAALWKYSLEQQYVPVKEVPYNSKDPQVDVESVPVEVDMGYFLDGVSIVQVACGSHKTFALTSDGFVYAWGAFVVSQITILR